MYNPHPVCPIVYYVNTCGGCVCPLPPPFLSFLLGGLLLGEKSEILFEFLSKYPGQWVVPLKRKRTNVSLPPSRVCSSPIET